MIYHEEAQLGYDCGAEKSPDHTFYCKKGGRSASRLRQSQRGRIEDDLKWTLGSVDGARTFD